MRMATEPHCQTCQDKALIQGWQSPKEAPWRYISLLIEGGGHAKVFDDYPKGPDVCLGCVDVVIQRLGSHPPTLIIYDFFFFLCSQFFILSIMILHLRHYNQHLKTWLVIDLIFLNIISRNMTMVIITIHHGHLHHGHPHHGQSSLLWSIFKVIMIMIKITWLAIFPHSSSHRCCSPSRRGWTQSQPPEDQDDQDGCDGRVDNIWLIYGWYMADDDKNIYFHLADILVSDKHVPCSQIAMNHLKLGCFNFSNAEFSFN